ncbi:MAG: hypothetical protein ACH255_20865 [Candidatus Thiodiazotropha sp.]
MLVGQVSSVTWPEIRLADPLISFEANGFETEVNSLSTSKSQNIITKEHIGGLRANTIVVPLAPGEYTLEGFRWLKNGQSIATAYGTYFKNTYITYPVKKKFSIKSGRATNIGMIVLEPIMQKSKSTLVPFFLDNTYEMTTYLEERHSIMFNSLKSKDFIKGYEVSLSPEKLSKLRRYIAVQKYKSKKWQYNHRNDAIVAGNVGTLAHVYKDSNGKPYIRKLYDPYSVADLSNCGIKGSRAVCVISSETILLLDNDKIKWHTLPEAVPINTATVFGDAGILLIDDFYRFHISYDNGNNWSQYTGMQREKPIERSNYDPMDMNSFGIHFGKSGYYVFEKGGDGPLVYADYKRGQHYKIQLPETVRNVTQVEEKVDRLFIGPSKTEIFNDKLHYLTLSNKKWTVIDVPTNYCSKMVILDYDAIHIEVYCGEKDVRLSMDRGVSWTKRTKFESYFNNF